MLLSRRGSLADQVIRLERPVSVASRAAPPVRTRSTRRARAPAAAAEPGVLQRAGRLRQERSRVRHHPRPWTVDACSVAQRRRQPLVRIPGIRVRLGLHMGGQRRENQLTPWSNDPSTTRQVRRSTSATTTAVTCGVRRRNRFAARLRRAGGMVPDTAASSTSTTASSSTSSSSCRPTNR